MPAKRLQSLIIPSALRAFLVVTAALSGPGAHAQNTPPPMAGPSVGPAGSTVSQAAVASGGLSASIGVLNPHLGGSPLWLWLEADGTGEVRLVDENERYVWRSGMRPFAPDGELVVIPRPSANVVHVEVTDGASPPVRHDLMVGLARPERAHQVSLPIVVVGGAQSVQLAVAMRRAAPDQTIHHMLPEQLPTTPAALLGTRVVVLGPDATLPSAQALAVRLFSCARGGVVTLAPLDLPPREGCQEPPLLLGEGGAMPPASALLQNLKSFQGTFGILEERGPSTVFGVTITDTDAAGALLSRRPPWQAAVVVILLSMVALGFVMHLSRKWRPGLAVLAMAVTPVVGGVVVVAAGFALAAPVEGVSLTTVDARTGHPVALMHTVEASKKRRPPDGQARSATAWVSTMEPTQESRKDGSALPFVTHIYDVVELPTPLASLPDPADPAEYVMRAEGRDAVRAYACGKNGVSVELPGLGGAQGRFLLEKCRSSRGMIAPLQPSWIPSLQGRGTDTATAWVYLRASERLQ